MWQKINKIFKSSFNVVSILVVIALWSGISYYVISNISKTSPSVANNTATDTSNTEESSEPENCNVYGINLHGDVVTYNSNDAYNDQYDVILDQTSADDIIWAVNEAQDNDKIKAIIVEIDSYGGSGVAGEEMMRTFKQSKKPVIAFIRSAGLSAAYLAATGAETIFASNFSDVGSIGVTMSYLQEAEKNAKEGLSYVDLSSGIYKDTGNPSRTLSEDEKQLLMRDVKISYEYFVKLVSGNRNLSIEKVKKLADGSSMMGEAALKNGLIDKIGIYPDVKNFLSEKIGTPAEICWKN
jgi:signal peptide peptidase SppA